jgi:hypothetical protein
VLFRGVRVDQRRHTGDNNAGEDEMAVKESAIERELVDRVNRLGGLCIKAAALGQRGFFDRIVVLPDGKVTFVELKRPKGGRVSAHQSWHFKIFSELGASVALIKSSEDIDRLLNT